MFRKRLGMCYFAEPDGITAGGNLGDSGAGADAGTPSTDNGNNGTFDFDSFKATYGKDYADKGFMQELTTPESMFRKIDNMESLIGKKAFIPGENATEDDWKSYRDKIGVKSVDDYTIDDSDLPDSIKAVHNDEVKGKIKQMFYDAGLSPQQAKILNKQYDSIMLEMNKDLLAKSAEAQKQQQLSDQEFDAITKETWGNDRENVLNVAKSLLQEFTPPNLKNELNNMDNKNLTIMASVLKGVSDKYISQDDLDALKGGKAGESVEDVRAEAQKELAKLTSMDQFDRNYEAQKQKVNELYASLKK